jgi:hypothetical protein
VAADCVAHSPTAVYLQLVLRTNAKDWKKVDGSAAPGPTLQTARALPALRTKFATLFAAGRHSDLSDFDDHLDNIERCDSACLLPVPHMQHPAVN